MDLVGIIERTGGLLGAEAVRSGTYRTGLESMGERHGGIRADSNDGYFPADRGEYVNPELPNAVRQQSGSEIGTSCYCGHCSVCQARASERSQKRQDGLQEVSAKDEEQASGGVKSEDDDSSEEETSGVTELTDTEEQEVAELRQRDQEVRAHEQAHVAAGARNAQYEYQTGPDGKQYAVGGSANIEISAMSDDHATKISEARKMRAAALAPADPSATDLAVAAKATRIEMEALSEKSEADRSALKDDQADQPLALDYGGYGQMSPNSSSAATGYFALA